MLEHFKVVEACLFTTPDVTCLYIPAAAATPALRFKVVQALAARGRADVALDMLRARRSGPEGTPSSQNADGLPVQDAGRSLAEAEAALSIRLECNLITEAFMEVSHR